MIFIDPSPILVAEERGTPLRCHPSDATLAWQRAQDAQVVRMALDSRSLMSATLAGMRDGTSSRYPSPIELRDKKVGNPAGIP